MRPSLAALSKYRFINRSGIMDNPIHLYRHLLRQAGVIYDDIVRTYIPKHIRRRFEANRNVTGHRLTEQLREARSGHSLLERANNGYPRALMKVMEMGYGRRGYRRHELMKPVLTYRLKPNPPIIEGDPDSAPPARSELLHALLAWDPPRHLSPIIPEKNIWDRPFPKNREVNIRKKHFAKLVANCPAPLPIEEYERLERFTKGEELPKPPRRKSKLKPTEGPMVVTRQLHQNEFAGRPHNMTPRSWRRVWQKIFSESPMLQFNEKRQAWEVRPKDETLQRPYGSPEDFDFEETNALKFKKIHKRPNKEKGGQDE